MLSDFKSCSNAPACLVKQRPAAPAQAETNINDVVIAYFYMQ